MKIPHQMHQMHASTAVLHEAGYHSHFGRNQSWLMTPEGDQISLYFSNLLWRVHLLQVRGNAHVPTDSGETVSGKDSADSESVGSHSLVVWACACG